MLLVGLILPGRSVGEGSDKTAPLKSWGETRAKGGTNRLSPRV